MKDHLGIPAPTDMIPSASQEAFIKALQGEDWKSRDNARRAICKYMADGEIPAVVEYLKQVADAGDLRRNVVMTFLRHVKTESPDGGRNKFQIRLLADYLRMLALEELDRALRKPPTKEKDSTLIEIIVCAGILACALREFKEAQTFLHRLERLGTQYFSVRGEFGRLADQIKTIRSELTVTQIT